MSDPTTFRPGRDRTARPSDDLPSPDEAERTLELLAGALFPSGSGELTQLSWGIGEDVLGGGGSDESDVAAKLRAAEMRYRTLVEQIPAVTFMANLGEGQNEIYVSPHIEAMLGFTQREWLENPFLWYAQLHPDDRGVWNEEFSRGVRTGGPFRAECRFLARDGSVVWVRGEARLVKDKLGRPLFLQGVAFDITESKRAEQRQIQEAIRTTEQRYRDLVEELGAIFWEADATTGRVTFVSSAAEAIFGFPRERWLDEPDFWLSRVHEEDRPRVRATRDRAMAGREQEVEFRAVTSDGRDIWIQATMQVHGEVEGERYVLGLMMDVTERKIAEQERARLYAEAEHARAAAEAASRSKDDFLATLSHELRTPLNALMGYAQVINTGMLPPDRLQYALKRIEAAALAQTRLVDDLLDVSRIITGKLPLDVSDVDLAKVTHAALETIRPAAAARQIMLTLDMPCAPLTVTGDGLRLQQVVWNLLSNAVKFTPELGQVHVLVGEVGRHARVRVTDSGMGINSDFLPHVFDRFRQADESQTRQYGGLGLGLAIVRHLVEMHGGSVSAESAGPGHGASFTVQLPLTTGSRSTIEDDPTPGEMPMRRLVGARVLVVDEDPDSLDLLRLALEGAGAEVRTASSVLEAVVQAARQLPDVLVSDIAMPGHDGYEFLRRMRTENPRFRELPAIAVSAFAGESYRRRALAAGFAEYLSKPLAADRVIEAVAKLL